MRQWIRRAAEIIVEMDDPDEIILFGSCARGRESLASDVDLLILKDTELPRIHRGVEVKEQLLRFPVEFDLLFYTPAELRDEMSVSYSFVHTVLATGIRLYKRPGFIEDALLK